ncbi:hypothetical protein EDD99_7145 [Streptomyces sp. 846.5]|nr:hypothetical protein [Streptomyces sp. 846.5]TDT95320.1 hypothetical protein EDD99_7145 [Streptomyces sp. 846.5]
MILDLIYAWIAAGTALGAVALAAPRRISTPTSWVFVGWLYVGIIGLLVWEVH